MNPRAAIRYPQFFNCPACERPNEPPFLFCAACGAPRVRVGRLRLMLNLTLAMIAFMATYLLAGDIGWDWPLYSYFAFFLLQFMTALVSGRWRLTVRTLLWFGVFYLLFMTIFTVQAFAHDPDIFLHLLTSLPDMATDRPDIFYPVLAGVVLAVLVPFYFRWQRLYGWHVAYRIALLALIAPAVAVLGVGWLLELARQRNLFPSENFFLDQFLSKAKPRLDITLGFFAVQAFRILAFEIFISSALQGYRAAATARLPDIAGRLEGESGFIHSLVMLGQVVRRFILLIENMVRSLALALADLGRGLWEVTLALIHELLLPALAMGGVGTLLYCLVAWTRAYIDENSIAAILKVLAAVAGLLLCVMVFIAAVARFRPVRIARFTMEFGGWLMPNLLVFFLLMSLSLYVTGRLWSEHDPETRLLAFRIGPLTRLDAVVLAVLVAVVIFRRRALFTVEGSHEAAHQRVDHGRSGPAPARPAHATASSPPIQTNAPRIEPVRQPKQEAVTRAVETETPKQKRSLPKTATWPFERVTSLLGRFKSHTGGAMSASMRVLGDCLQGKPLIIEQAIKQRQKREEKLAQLRSLEKFRHTIAWEAYEKLWTTTRGELTFLEVELERLQTELDRQFAARQMEKATLEARLAGLNLEQHEDAKTLSDRERARIKAAMTEIELLTRQLEDCERQIAYLAPEAGQPAGSGRGA